MKKNKHITVPELLEEWLEVHKLEISESTAYQYEMSIRPMMVYFAGARVYTITLSNVQGYVMHLHKQGMTNNSIYSHCKALKLAFKFAKKAGYIRKNPMKEISFPKKQRVEIIPFSEGEIQLLLVQNTYDWVRDGALISYRTGMRLGEVFGLKWTDINFNESFIMIQRSLVKSGSIHKMKTTKTINGVRRIEIDSHLLKYLQDMKSRSKSAYVFSMPDFPEKYRVPWNISARIREMCVAAGIPPRNFHTLRHTHATVLMAHNTHTKIVQERLGHSSILITAGTYSHVSPTIQQAAVKVFEDIPI